MRICVIGSGILGASVAHRLARQSGVEVAVVDAKAPGTGTTAVSFAWVNANSKRPREYFDLNYAGLREYERLTDELGDSSWLHGGGCLVTRDFIPDVTDLVDELRSWDYRAELLDARYVTKELEPRVEFGDPDLPVGFFPDEFCVDAVPLTGRLVAEAVRSGAEAHFGMPVTDIDTTNRSFTVRLGDGTTLSADAVVNTAGAAADVVGAMVGSPVPMASTWGTTILVDAPGHGVGRIVHTGTVDIRPEGVDLLRVHYTPVDERIGAEGTDRAELAADLVRRVGELVPGVTSRLASSHLGIRPIPADGLTSAGAVASVPGYYEISTHSGVTLGPLLGRLVADEIVHDRVDPLLEPFRPDRFPGR